MGLSAESISTLDTISTTEWNLLVNNTNPFLKHEFLAGLERFHCLEPHGWKACHIVIYEADKLVGALPLYFKTNSNGEFVFDWTWAEAYERAGGRYYPKLVSAVPFTPVTGSRLLISPDYSNKKAISDLIIKTSTELMIENNLSGLHYLFPDQNDIITLKQSGHLLRMGCQYHWFNQEYNDFNDYLGALNTKRRKQINRERKSVRESNIKIEILKGNEIDDEQWRIFYQFYCSTFLRKWGEPRLTLNFFKSLSKYLPESTLLLLAKHNGEYVAGAYAMQSSDVLYGRHWGCSKQFQYLHFELCYYQTIEYCINHDLKRLDAGAQGEHKISRGFTPVRTWSAHCIRESQFREAIKDYLQQEQIYIDQYIESLLKHSPYKHIIS